MHAVHFQAMQRAAGAGISDRDPKFNDAYLQHRAAILKEMGHGASA